MKNDSLYGEPLGWRHWFACDLGELDGEVWPGREALVNVGGVNTQSCAWLVPISVLQMF